MPKKKECATIRVVVKMTNRESEDLKRICEKDVRTIGSWFRLQVRRAWATRKPPKKQQGFLRNELDGKKRTVDVWARLTDTERDQLDILCDDAGVSTSIWFRRRLREALR